MASRLSRGTLARAAAALNATSGFSRLPPLLLITDEIRMPDPVALAALLPRGAGIILRHTDAHRRETLALALAALAHARGLILLVAGDAALAARVHAHGLHLPERRAREAAHWRARHPRWLITVAAHSERSLRVAATSRADASLLGPVFATASHPERLPLTPLKARLMAARASLPVYGLGGINATTIKRLHGGRFAGAAAIEGLQSE